MADFSAAPFNVLAVDYDKVLLSWSVPTGTYVSFRIVRNQIGYAETAEDGIILLEDLYGYVRTGFIDDGTAKYNTPVQTASLVQGKYAHYSAWVKFSTGKWSEVARAYCLIPKNHSTSAGSTELVSMHDKMMSYIPRVYTSVTQSPLDELDTSSDLYNFLKGFSLSFDEIMTYTDLLVPSNDPSTISPAALPAEIAHVGSPEVYLGASKTQKNLIANLPALYPLKGTKTALDSFITLLTGFSTTISDSPNLMLSTQSSSFNGGLDLVGSFDLGGWIVPSTSTGTTLTYNNGNVAQITASSSTTGTTTSIAITSATGTPATGQYITGTNIAVGTYIVAVSGSGTSYTLTLNQATTGTLSGTYTMPAFTDIPLTEKYSLQLPGRAVVAGSSGTNTISICNPVDVFRRGIPVTPGTTYAATYYVKYTAGSTPTTKALVDWYDNSGNKIGNTVSWTSNYTPTAVWSKATGTGFKAPSYNSVIPATVTITSNVVYLTFSSNHGFVDGETVYISNSDPMFAGTHTITVTSTTAFNFPLTAANLSSTSTVYMVVESQYKVAYAVLSIQTSSGSTQYIDLVNFCDWYGSGATNYHEARGAEIYLAPTKTNYLLNPSFELASIGPVTVTATGDGTQAVYTVTSGTHGLTSGQIVATYFQFTPEASITGAVYVINSTSFSIYNSALVGAASGNGTVSTLDWNLDAGTGTFSRVSGSAVDVGSYSGQIAVSSSTTPVLRSYTYPSIVTIASGQYYTFSIYMKASVGTPTNVQIKLLGLGTGSISSVSPNISLSTSWARYSVSIFIPSNWNSSTTQLEAVVTTAAAISSTTIQLDGAQLELGTRATDYFDGSYTAIEASWASTRSPHSSVSYYYANKTAKLALLKSEIVKWLPYNTPYMVSTTTGVEMSGMA